MTSPVLILRLLSTTVLVLALAACAPAVRATSSPTAHPQRTTRPQPTATHAAAPSVRVPVTCSSLFTDAAAAALIDSPVDQHRDASSAVVDTGDVVARQYGSLRCLWGAEPQDSGYVYALTVDITPDAAAGYSANVTSFAQQDPPVTTNTAGDQSVFGCADDGGLSCTGNMLVGGYWVSAGLQDIAPDSISSATANARIQQVLTTVAAALKNTKSGAAWKPSGALPTFCSAPGSTAAVNSALGGSDFSTIGDDTGTVDAASYPQTLGNYTQCVWKSASSSGPFSYLSIALLRGGAWAVPQMSGQFSRENYMLSAYGPMTVPGATSAEGNCSIDADQCQFEVAIGSLLVAIGMDDPSDALSSAAVAKIVAAIKAS